MDPYICQPINALHTLMGGYQVYHKHTKNVIYFSAGSRYSTVDEIKAEKLDEGKQ